MSEQCRGGAQPGVTYTLTLDETQASALCQACELFARLEMGQLNELTWLRGNQAEYDGETMEAAIGTLRRLLFPDLIHPGANLGINNAREVAKSAWDILQAVRHRMAWTRRPGGGQGVWFDSPMRYGPTPLPECRADTPDAEQPRTAETPQ